MFACQLAGLVEPTPTPPSSSNPIPPIESAVDLPAISNEPLAGVASPLPAVRYAPFGVAEPVSVNIPAVIPLIEPSPAKLTDIEQYGLSSDEFAQLGRDGYLVRSDRVGTIQDVYGSGGPLMLTVDMVLLSTVATHQQALASAAAEFGPKHTYDMISGLIIQTQQQVDAAESALAEQAALRNLAIFTLAGRFFDESWPVPPDVQGLVETELALFSAEGDVSSPLLNKTVNYAEIWAIADPSTRARAWLLLASPEFDFSQLPSAQRLVAGQIELMLQIWQSEAVPAWMQLYDLQQYQNGSGDLVIEDWLALAELGLSGDDFLATVEQFPAGRFDILPRSEPFQQQVFDQLVFNRVGVHESPDDAPDTAITNEAGTVRAIPRVIDLAAAFGSAQALSQLESDGESGYAGWGAQMAALQARSEEPNGWPATYSQDLLKSLQPLADQVPASYPTYMQTLSWNGLAQWENLVLASLSPLTFQNNSLVFDPSAQMIVLEPRPEIYANLAAQTRVLAEGLAELQMLDQPNADRLLALENDLLVLKNVAENGLAGNSSTAEEVETVARTLSNGTRVQLSFGWQIYSGPLGGLTARNSGVMPTLFVVFNGGDLIVVQGGRLQTLLIEN